MFVQSRPWEGRVRLEDRDAGDTFARFSREKRETEGPGWKMDNPSVTY